jgi:hypothetical protein
MDRKSAVSLLFGTSLLTASLIAEDPLPLVRAKGAAELPSVVFASYPIRNDISTVSVDTGSPAGIIAALRKSAADNDLPRFSAARGAAKSMLETLPPGGEREALKKAIRVADDIDAVWTFNVTDRFGAFYDNEALPGLHEHLTASYPGYEDAIAGDSIVDRHGHVLYPSAETRAFLARQIAAPSGRASQPKVAGKKSTPATHHRAALKASAAPVRHPSRTKAKATEPALAVQQPVVQAAQTASAAPPAQTTQTAPPSVIVIQAPPPVAIAPVAVAAVRKAEPAPQRAPASAPVTDQAQIIGTTASRGVLLILVALAAIGAVSALLRPAKRVPAPPPAADAGADTKPHRHTA